LLLKRLIEIDDFVKRLWKIYQKGLTSGYNQKLQLIILRSDYMLHKQSETASSSEITMKLVEVNTISAGFGYVGGKMSKLHREILKWFNCDHLLDRLPENEPLASLAQGFVQAWQRYNMPNSIILFIVLDYEINIADQRHLEYEILKQDANIEIVRCTLNDLYMFGSLNEDKVLCYKQREVAIVYFRAAYDPSHFKSQNVYRFFVKFGAILIWTKRLLNIKIFFHKEWDALLNIELSKAVKCPSVGVFLAGMKKIQEHISHDENLITICNNDLDMANQIKSVFVNFFKLDKKVFN
jgi:hypothetical protein